MKFLLAGHSFIRRLRDEVDPAKPFDLDGVHAAYYCCQGGWGVPQLRQVLNTLPSYQIAGAIVYLDIGTNDLSSPLCNPAHLAAEIRQLVMWLLQRGARFIAIGEILPRFGRSLGHPTRPDFNYAVDLANDEIIRAIDGNQAVKFWRHQHHRNPIGRDASDFDQAGIHFNSETMPKYLRSVRGALLFGNSYSPIS